MSAWVTIRLMVIAAVASGLLVNPAIAANWAQDGYDPGGTAANPAEGQMTPDNVETLVPFWTAQLGIRQGAALVVGQKLYATIGYTPEGGDGGVTARDARTGAVLWERQFGDRSMAGQTLATGSGALFATVRDEVFPGGYSPGNTSSLLALHPATGAVLWRHQMPNARALVSTGGGSVFVTNDTSIRALDPASGRLQWARQMSRGFTAVPALYSGGRLYVQEYNSALFVLDAKTGRTLATWRLDPGYTSVLPVISGGMVYLNLQGRVGEPGLVQAWPAACERTCQPLWSRSLPNVSRLVLVDGLVVTGGFDQEGSTVSALDARTGRLVWQDLVVGYANPQAAAGGVVYVVDVRDQRILTYRASGCGAPRCAPLSVLQIPGSGRYEDARPSVVDGLLYVARATEGLIAYRPSEASAPPVSLDGTRLSYVPRGTRVPLTGRAAPGARVDVLIRPAGQVAFTPRLTAVADRSGVWRSSFTASGDVELLATAGALHSGKRTIGVAATLAGPALVGAPRNAMITMTGTAVPGSTVLVRFHRAGRPAGDFSVVHRVVARADGRWFDTYRADVDHRLYVTRANGSAPSRRVEVVLPR